MVKLSNRILLRVEDETKAGQVLDMYLRNRIAFEAFEPTRPDNFYTKDYHAAMLRREYKAYQLGTFLRYYIYKPANINRIIGAVNFNFLQDGTGRYAEIGYKVDALYQNQGIGYEACRLGIEVMHKDYHFTRIDARIHPHNIASIHLASKLGFVPVSLEPQSANIMGHYVDLMRYTLDISDIQ
jgi:ribosomal-protein-alanine N-acetyltransferase